MVPPRTFKHLVLKLPLLLVIYICVPLGCDTPLPKNQLSKRSSKDDTKSLTHLDSLIEARAYTIAIAKAKNYILSESTKSDPYLRGLTHIKLYQALTYNEQYEESRQEFEKLIANAQLVQDDLAKKKLLGKAYLSQAKVLQDTDQYDTSVDVLNLSRKYLREVLPEEEVYSYILSTKVAYFNYQNEQAMSYLGLADSIAKVYPLTRYTASLIDNWYDLVLQDLGEYERAIARSEKILSRISNVRSETLSDEELNLVNHTYQNLGTLYVRKGDIEKGLKYYERALEVINHFEETDVVESSKLLNNIGVGNLDFSNFKEALIYFRRVIAFQDLENLNEDGRKSKTEALLHAAYCHRKIGNFDSTLIYAHKGLKLNNQDPDNLDYAYLTIASSYLGTGQYQEALDTVTLSILELEKKLGSQNRPISFSFRLEAEIFLKMGHLKKALNSIQKALIASSKDFSPETINANPTLASVYDKKGLLENLQTKAHILLTLSQKEPTSTYLHTAWETYQLANEVIEYLRKDFEEDASKFHLLSKTMPIFEKSLETITLLDQGKQDPSLMAQAFAISEQGKSMILQDHMRTAYALQSPDIPPAMKRKEDSLRINIAFYGNRVRDFDHRGKLNSYDSTQYQNSQRILSESEEAYSSLMRYFEQNYQEYARRKKETPPLPVEQILSHLDSTEMSLIEYFWGKKHVYAFLLHEGTINMYRFERNSTWEQSLDSLKIILSDATRVLNQGNSQDAIHTYVRRGYDLYQHILEPLLAEIPPNRKLVIIPDGPLNVFPFEALPYKSKDSAPTYEALDYVLYRHQIQYALSAELLRKGYKQASNKYIFLGYAPSYQGVRKLEFNEQEVTEIAHLVNGTALTGKDASKQSFMEHGGNTQFLHLAQHAVKEEDPLLSYLLFSSDPHNQSPQESMGSLEKNEDKLYAYEIYTQEISCQLAVLNACETGEGVIAQGEGMLSLSRAFRHAGAQSIIMNKWAVNDESSFRILSDFYVQLKSGLNTASALRQAKVNYLQRSHKTHPYFWASTSLIGNSINIDIKESPPLSKSHPNYWFFMGFWALGIIFLIYTLGKLSTSIYQKDNSE